MKKEDIEFRKKCQLYHNKIKGFLRKGQLNQAQGLVGEVQQSLKAWDEHIKSARFKANLLKSLLATVTLEMRRNERFVKLSKRTEERLKEEENENGGLDDFSKK